MWISSGREIDRVVNDHHPWNLSGRRRFIRMCLLTIDILIMVREYLLRNWGFADELPGMKASRSLRGSSPEFRSGRGSLEEVDIHRRSVQNEHNVKGRL